MEYEEKYIKYKKKYLELKGGGDKNNIFEFDKIVDFITHSKKEEIAEKLLDLIQNTSFCPILLGQGFTGNVFLPEIDRTFPYKIGNKIVQLPVVIKVASYLNDINHYFGYYLLDNKLYISGYRGLTTETLILMFINNLRNKTVHLPLLLTYATCSKTKVIDRIYTLRYGLDKPVEINLINKIYNEVSLWQKQYDEPIAIFKNNVSTLIELFDYIHYSKNKDDNVILPNNIMCNITELYDYLCISYLATHHLLIKNNIFPSDMNCKNIFIHWLNDSSYYKDKNIKNLEEIIYKIGNKYYKIKTFGFVLILGDTGTFVIKIKEDIILAGHAANITTNYFKYDRIMTDTHNNIEFIKDSMNYLTPKQFKNTIVSKIINTEPYCNYPIRQYKLLGTDISYLDNMKPTTELLKFFYDKYGVSKYEKKNNNILITIN
jgi:hypothetical protein